MTGRLRFVRTLVALLAAAGLLAVPVEEGSAIHYPAPWSHRPSAWMPTFFTTDIVNRSESSSELVYHMQWQNPRLYGLCCSRDDPVFEIGWKNLPTNDNCGSRRFGRAGFPANMDVQIDYTEDPDDKVIWMGNLNLLVADIQENRGKVYKTWTNCDELRRREQRPYAQSQIGHYGSAQEPWNTWSDATLNHVPAEQAQKAFPTEYSDRKAYRTYMLAPWVHNGNAEHDYNPWRLDKAGVIRACGANPGGDDGRCYWLAYPTGTGTTSRLYQRFEVATYTQPDYPRYRTGFRTGLQLESAVRCERGNPRPCLLTFYVRPVGRSTWMPWRYEVPNDHRWYYLVNDKIMDQRAEDAVSSDFVDLIIDTHRSVLHVDALWISSDI